VNNVGYRGRGGGWGSAINRTFMANGLKYILRFGRFYARYNPEVRAQGGRVEAVCQTDDVGQRGGCPKNQFLLLSL